MLRVTTQAGFGDFRYKPQAETRKLRLNDSESSFEIDEFSFIGFLLSHSIANAVLQSMPLLRALAYSCGED